MTVRMMCAACVLFAGPLAHAQQTGGGSLLIAGGAIAPDNADIANALIAAMPDPAGTIAIIPGASAEPQASFDSFRDYLVRHGVDASRITLVRIALIDDPGTLNVDEARWADNADNAVELDSIARAGAIWFTGGDQARTARLLMTADGGDTFMLRAIRARLDAGSVVGGSSAGAAIMGAQMIVCGDADGAPSQPVQRNMALCEAVAEDAPVPLVIARGLGFVPWAITDQHFSQRKREGRLERAVAAQPPGARIGIGVDENSAVLVRLRDRSMTPVSGRTTLYDARQRRLRVRTLQASSAKG